MAMVPTLLAIAATAVAADLSDIQFHGFASQGYLATTGADLQGRTSGGGTFDFNEFALNATATPIERLRIGVQLFAGDLGKYGNDKVLLDWAYGSYQVPESIEAVDLTVSAGRIKSGVGMYGDYRDLDMTRTMVFMPMTVYSARYRDLAIAVNGASVAPTFELGKAGSLELAVISGGMNVEVGNGTPVGDAFSQYGALPLDSADVKRVDIVNLAWNTPLDGLRVRGTYQRLHEVSFSGSSAVGVSVDGELTGLTQWFIGAEYQHDALTLAAEYTKQKTHLVETITYPPSTVIDADVETTSQAGYLLATYQVTKQWSAGACYNWAIGEAGAPQTAAQIDARSLETRGVALGVRFDPTQHWLIKAEFQRNKGTSLVDYNQNPTPDLYWSLFAIKTTFDF